MYDEDIKEEDGRVEEQEEEEEGVKDGEEYEYSVDSGTYQASDYMDSFYYEKSGQTSRGSATTAPLTRGDSCECYSHSQAVD